MYMYVTQQSDMYNVHVQSTHLHVHVHVHVHPSKHNYKCIINVHDYMYTVTLPFGKCCNAFTTSLLLIISTSQ